MNNKLIKNRKILLILIAIVIVIAIITSYSIFNAMNSPEKVLNKYIEAVNQRDYERMYALTSDKEKNEDRKTQFIEKNKNIYEGINGQNMAVKEIRSIQKVKSNYQIIDYGFTMDTLAGPITEWGVVRFQKNGIFKPYQIVWEPSVILPELQKDGTVTVTEEPAKRGDIIDRNGNPLATTGVASAVGLVPGKMNAETRDADFTKLAELLSMTVEAIQTALSAEWVTDDTFVPVKTIAGGNTALETELLKIPGVMINDESVRFYPYGKKTSHLTGYIQGISAEELAEKKDEDYTENSVIGKSGLERLYDERLRGEDGITITVNQTYPESNMIAKEVIKSKEPVRGKDVKTTIDINLQNTLYDQFAADKSCSVAINPKTGEVLALVSTPTYDANTFILGLSDEKWHALNADPANPLFSRFESIYVPGSSFKPVTAAAGLETGAFTADEDFGPSGLVWQQDSSWEDFNITTLEEYSGPANLENALVYSDNIYFAKAALKIGGDRFADTLKKLGFGETIPIDLDMSPSQISESGGFDNEAQLAASGFGQGQILVNPLHMASIYSSFTNDGSMIKPYIEYKENIQPEYWKEQVISKDISDIIRNDLIQVVENPAGTGHEARIEGMSIAGKTGTAEIKASQDDVTGTELGWFNAFIADSASSQQLMVVSMVEDVKDRGGSHYLVPKIKAVFQSLIS
ncbi:penicillin-binding transpeptidase domain-containing protein [Eubacterium sp. AM05-23]|uniref:penicillin-binding transpeptidase domain-containing protein n=1 Tax=Eubacterium TaxID=1730 RepID=UPI000E4BF7B5|nr:MULTISPECIES: penicillin-binding transpeptidase domain-containing protein [Eubacterium]RHO56663.1 penicillin-binding transpeptidase domain-containing protein [Eubacterium sp. AM05-23]